MIKTNVYIKGVLLPLLLMISQVSFASAISDFKEGIRFFKNSQYNKALNAFHLAEEQGLSTVNLYYNIASSYYKNGQYPLASRYFHKVRQFPKMRVLAEYNLGLTAKKMKNKLEEKKWFDKVAQQNKNIKLKNAAIQLMSKSENISAKKTIKKWSVYSSFALNTESNPSFSATNAVANKSDTNNEILLFADYQLSKKRKNALKAEVAYYRVDYSSLNAFDFTEFDVGVNKAFTFDKKLGLTLFANTKKSTLNSASYQNTIKLASNVNFHISKKSRVVLRYSLDNISNNSATNARLDGTRHKFKLQYAMYNRGASHKYIMQYEMNNRKDLTSATGTKSYSPKRITFRYKYAKRLNKKWRLVGDVSYRQSNYPALSFTARADDRIKASGYVDYKLGKTAKLRAKLAYTDNNSTDNALDYVNNASSVYFIKTF